MLVSVTRLRVRSFFSLPAFLFMTEMARRQTVRAPDFLGGRLLADRHRTYWTLTAWRDEKAMRAFRGSGSHARVMPKLISWCDEAAYAHWTSSDNSLPDWAEAHRRLMSDGKLSRVSRPSQDHAARIFPAPSDRARFQGTLTPLVR